MNKENLITNFPQHVAEWNFEKNTGFNINKLTIGSNKKVWWEGSCGHDWETSIKSKCLLGSGCPYCANRKILVGFNDMWTTNKELASKLLNEEDGYRYMQKANQKVDWKCPDCNLKILDKKISDVNLYGLSCPCCSDGIPYPQKFIGNFLKQVGVDFKGSFKAEWSKNRLYDFYFEIEGKKVIVEAHGGQHYNGGFKTYGGKTLAEEEHNDRAKKSVAIKNGIDFYIEVDCRESTLLWIKNSIKNSELNNLFSLESIDWELIAKQSSETLTIKAYSLWKSGITNMSEIGRRIGVSSITVRRYIDKLEHHLG